MKDPIIPLVRPTFPWFAGLILMFSFGGFIVHTALFWVQWDKVTNPFHRGWPKMKARRRVRNASDIENAAGMVDPLPPADAQSVLSSNSEASSHAQRSH